MTSSVRAYLDTNVFVEAYEMTTARSDHARWLLRAIEQGEVEAATSELTLAELLVKPLQRKAKAVAAAYRSVVRSAPGFLVVPVRRDILVEAAAVRADRLSIRLPDAIHVATARHAGCGCLVTGDRRLSTEKGPITLSLGPSTVDDIARVRS